MVSNTSSTVLEKHESITHVLLFLTFMPAKLSKVDANINLGSRPGVNSFSHLGVTVPKFKDGQIWLKLCKTLIFLPYKLQRNSISSTPRFHFLIMKTIFRMAYQCFTSQCLECVKICISIFFQIHKHYLIFSRRPSLG